MKKSILLLKVTCILQSFSSGFHTSISHNTKTVIPSIIKNNNIFTYQRKSGVDSKTKCNMEPLSVVAGGSIVAVTSVFFYFSGSEERQKKRQYAEWEEQARVMQEERARLAYIEPREYWTIEDLRPYDGRDEDGPILMAVNGDVYNVWKGRHFYGPGCEYHILAGRDATRLLAKTKLEEETEDELKKELSIADRATLQGWIYTFKSKYEIVGKLDGFDPSSTTTRTS